MSRAWHHGGLAPMRLDTFSTAGFDRGASRATEAAWLALSGVLVASWLPGSRWRARLLRAFGAQIGTGVVLKPGVRVKFPWRLSVGDHAWIGEDVWIDNLAEVMIGDHACVSQGSYLCTGSHDWASKTFNLITKPIFVHSKAWVGAKSVIAPGCNVGEGTVLAIGSVASGDLDPWTVYSGSPAKATRMRIRPT